MRCTLFLQPIKCGVRNPVRHDDWIMYDRRTFFLYKVMMFCIILPSPLVPCTDALTVNMSELR